MTGRRTSREERLAKQRDYQREYRKRLKESRKPDRNAIAQVFLYHLVVRSLGKAASEKRLVLVLKEVEQLLVDLGFDGRETRSAIDEIIERYEAGWSFQRKLHLLSTPEAAAIGEGFEGEAD